MIEEKKLKYTAYEFYKMTDSEFRELYESENFRNVLEFLETRIRLEILSIIRRFRLKGEVLFEVRKKTATSTYAKLQKEIVQKQADIGEREIYLFEIIRDLVGARLICMHDEIQKRLFDFILQVESLAIQPEGLEYYSAPFREYTLSKDIHGDLARSISRLHQRSKEKSRLEKKTKLSNYESLHFYVKFASKVDKVLLKDLTSGTRWASKSERIRDRAESEYLETLLNGFTDLQRKLIAEIPIEFQIRTITDHLWAQEEHRYVYKNSNLAAYEVYQDDTLDILRSAFTGLKFAYFNVERLRSLVRSISESKELPSPSYSGDSKDINPIRFHFFGKKQSEVQERFSEAEKDFFKYGMDLSDERVRKNLFELNSFVNNQDELNKKNGSREPIWFDFDYESWGRKRLFYLFIAFNSLFSKKKYLPSVVASELDENLDLSELVGHAAYRASFEDDEGSLKLAAKLYERIQTFDGVSLSVINSDDEHSEIVETIFSDPLVRIRLASSFFLQDEFAGARRALSDLFMSSGEPNFFEWKNSPLAEAFSTSEILMRYSQYIFFESFEERNKLIDNFPDLTAVADALFSVDIDDFCAEHYRSYCWYYSVVNYLFTKDVFVPPKLSVYKKNCREYLLRHYSAVNESKIAEKPEVQMAMVYLPVDMQIEKDKCTELINKNFKWFEKNTVMNSSYPRSANASLLIMASKIKFRALRKANRSSDTTFLSYTRRNHEKAKLIVEYLERENVCIVYDELFKSGEGIVHQIETAMVNASTAILLVTSEYLESAWAIEELHFLMDKRRREELRLFILNDGVSESELKQKAPLLSNLVHYSGEDAELEASLARLSVDINRVNSNRS